MQLEYFPEIVQVVPHADYTVTVYFSDGKIVSYDVKPHLDSGVFRALQDRETFINCCTIMNDTLAWDVNHDGNLSTCIDIDPETLYALEGIDEKLAV